MLFHKSNNNIISLQGRYFRRYSLEFFISKSSRPLAQLLSAALASQMMYLCLYEFNDAHTQALTSPVPPHLLIHLPTQTKVLCCNIKMDRSHLMYSKDNFSATKSFNFKRETTCFRPGRHLLWLNLSTFLAVHKKSVPTFSTLCLQKERFSHLPQGRKWHLWKMNLLIMLQTTEGMYVSMYTRGMSCTFPKITYISFLRNFTLYLKNKTKWQQQQKQNHNRRIFK